MRRELLAFDALQAMLQNGDGFLGAGVARG